MIGETAKMLAQLDFKDNLTKGTKTAIASVGKLEQKFGTLGKGLGKLGSNIKNLISGPLGMIGLGAGILGVGKFLQDSVAKARDFGDAVFKVKAIIGGTTQATSQLVDVLGDYGIASDAIVRIGGMFEKNIGNIAKSTKSAAKFQADYGFSILDSAGKAKDFNTVLLEAADIFTSKTIPQSTKAAALAKLYGRNWQELVPILSLGRTELEKTLGKAITLTDGEAKALERARKAGIKWDDALGDLQTMIGIELLPVITRLVNRMTRFVQDHGGEIRAFFRDAATFAQGMGQAIKRDVLPALQRIGEIWAGVPDDLKKLLIGGFVLNKLTGGAVTGIISELGKGLIKGVLGMNAGVVNINAGVVNGGAPGAGAAAGGIGAGAALVGGATIGAVVIGAAVTKGMIDSADAIAAQFPALTKAEVIATQVRNLGGLEAIGLRGKTEVVSQLKALGTDYDSALRSATAKMTGATRAAASGEMRSGTLLQRALHSSAASTNRNLDQVDSAIRAGTGSTARNLDQVTSAIRSKKLAVRVTQNQKQSSVMSLRNATGGTTQGKPGFHYTRSQGQDLSRFLATGAVGVANRPTSAIFGEAGREAFAILRNPRKGTIGGGGGTTVNVTVNIDPRRITKKQSSSGIYKTYVAT